MALAGYRLADAIRESFIHKKPPKEEGGIGWYVYFLISIAAVLIVGAIIIIIKKKMKKGTILKRTRDSDVYDIEINEDM